jgi:hypothetical protein
MKKKKPVEQCSDFDGFKDHKGRVDPNVAGIRVIDVIESCTTLQHIKGAEQMVKNFYALYNDWIFDETADEIGEAMVEQKLKLHLNEEKQAE